MRLKFTHEAVLKGYSFLAGETHSVPDQIGELMISDGVAFQIANHENTVDKKAKDALNEATQRDGGHKSN